MSVCVYGGSVHARADTGPRHKIDGFPALLDLVFFMAKKKKRVESKKQKKAAVINC